MAVPYAIGARADRVCMVLPIAGEMTPEEAITAAAKLYVMAAVVGMGKLFIDHEAQDDGARNMLDAAIEEAWG